MHASQLCPPRRNLTGHQISSFLVIGKRVRTTWFGQDSILVDVDNEICCITLSLPYHTRHLDSKDRSLPENSVGLWAVFRALAALPDPLQREGCR